MRLRLFLVIPILLLVNSINLLAQKKDFSYAQLFQGTATDISRPLPVITKWIDDEHYVIMNREEGEVKSKMMSVEVKSGKTLPYEEKPEINNSPSASSLGLNRNGKKSDPVSGWQMGRLYP
jgi:hypothetical protein